ncbi:MAG: LysM peptidoglycan-binding domain-containing protein [Actinomycetota bacterium]
MQRTGVRLSGRPEARVRVRWGRVAVLAAAFLIPLGAHAAAGATDDPARPARVYVVQPGDTLWSIAVHVAGPGADPRPVVDELADSNGISGPIVPGQRLELP